MGMSAAKVRQLQEAAECGDIDSDREVGIGGTTSVCRRQSGRELVLQLRAATRIWRNVPQMQFFLHRCVTLAVALPPSDLDMREKQPEHANYAWIDML